MKSFEDHPFQLAAGANEGPDDQFGCTMNVVSWMNGDTEITDMPDCTNGTLGGLVVAFNDEVLSRFGVPGRRKTVQFAGADMPVVSNVATPAQAMRLLNVASLVMNTAHVDAEASWDWRCDLVGGYSSGWSYIENLVMGSDTFDHAVDRFLAEVVLPFRTQFEIGAKENADV